jgi:uncharacterized protein (TIGR00369 family)
VDDVADERDEALTAEEQDRRRQAVPPLLLSTPFVSWLGLEVVRYEPDDVMMRLPFRHELTNDGQNYHGGVVASVLDTTGGLAAFSAHDFDRGMRPATVSLAVQYVAAARGSDLLCTATVVRRVRELTFSEVTAADPDGRVLAHALQTYRIA